MDIKVYLMGLSIACPHHEEENDCPFEALREVPVTRLIEVTNKLSPESQAALVRHHKHCLKAKSVTRRKVS